MFCYTYTAKLDHWLLLISYNYCRVQGNDEITLVLGAMYCDTGTQD